MRRLLLATNNAGKVIELRQLLAPLDAEVLLPRDLGLALDPAETGDTYAANARIKAHAFARASGLPALSDDSGFEVDGLNGRPGVYSARYGPPGATVPEQIALLLDELRGVPDERRGARFIATVVVALPDGRSWQAEGVLPGVVPHEPRGTGGFGYDPILLLPALGRTVAELTDTEKNELSHRARAVRAALPAIREALALFAATEAQDG